MTASRWWVAVLDGDIAGADFRATREEAQKDAAFLENHPATADRRLFGHGGRIEVMQVEADEWLDGEYVRL